MLKEFSGKYKAAIESHHHRRSANLSLVQRRILKSILENDNVTILLSDKNLGPVAIPTERYVQLVLQDHLLQTNTYRQLTPETAIIRKNNTTKQIRNFILALKKMDDPPANDISFLYRCLQENTRTSQFYGLPKIHKMTTNKPLTLRPIISSSRTPTTYWNCWNQYQIYPQPLDSLPLMPSPCTPTSLYGKEHRQSKNIYRRSTNTSMQTSSHKHSPLLWETIFSNLEIPTGIKQKALLWVPLWLHPMHQSLLLQMRNPKSSLINILASSFTKIYRRWNWHLGHWPKSPNQCRYWLGHLSRRLELHRFRLDRHTSNSFGHLHGPDYLH